MYSMNGMALKRYTFMIDGRLDDGLKRLKERDGISESQAVRRAIEDFLQNRGIAVAPPEKGKQMHITAMIPIAPGAVHGEILVDVEESRWYGVDEAEIAINFAKTYLEQVAPKNGKWKYVIRPAKKVGFSITVAKGEHAYTVRTLDLPLPLLQELKVRFDDGHWRLEEASTR
jgi:hypothetical protein